MAEKGRLQGSNTDVSADFFRVSIQNITDLLRNIREKIRSLYYRAVLFTKQCPACKAVELVMVKDSWCRCAACGAEFDPTLEFQVCLTCRAKLNRKMHHYWCEKCRQRVTSIFCFDAKIFDAAYFREMMRVSRQRKQQKREEIRQMLANCRSPALISSEEPSLADLPGLEGQLDRCINTAVPIAVFRDDAGLPPFGMDQYRQHILELVSGCVVRFEGMSKVIQDARLDRIYRFITVVFMEHDGAVVLKQEDGGEILIEENEAHREGQAVH